MYGQLKSINKIQVYSWNNLIIQKALKFVYKAGTDFLYKIINNCFTFYIMLQNCYNTAQF